MPNLNNSISLILRQVCDKGVEDHAIKRPNSSCYRQRQGFGQNDGIDPSQQGCQVAVNYVTSEKEAD